MSRSADSAPRLLLLCLPLLIGLVATTAEAGRGADGHFDRRSSSHFTLLQDVDIDRYSGRGGSREFERRVLQTLESAYGAVSDLLNLRPRHRIEVRIYDPDVFDSAFGGLFGFRAAGFFDGLIHVRGGTEVDARLVRTLYHEYLHAAVDAAGGGGLFPGWLNEGLAEYVEHRALGARYLNAGVAGALIQARDGGFWIPLANLSSPSFGHLGGNTAALAYMESHGIVVYLARRYGERTLRDLCQRLLKTRRIAGAVERTYRKDLSELEAEFLKSLR